MSVAVSGLTIVRNGVRLDYPFLEVIRSGLPLCDEYLVVVGDSDDDTSAQVEALDDPRIRIIRTTWSDHVTPRQCLLAQQTNIGLHQCQGRWCVYLQGNEVIHERDHATLRGLMRAHADDAKVEALLLERRTFWADYDHWLTTYPERFKFSARIIKPHVGMHSIRDANSFAVFDRWSTRGRYPRSIDTGCDIYRYGKVRSVAKMAEKLRDAVHEGKNAADLAEDYYYQELPRQYIAHFDGDHPAVMAERVAAFGSQYDLADSRCRTTLSFKERRRLWETWWYSRFGYPRRRNNRYQLLGSYAAKARP